MRRKIDLLILIAVIVAGFFTVRNAVIIGDWVHSRLYEPSSQVVSIADDAGMSERGRQLFYRFSPALVSRTQLDEVCTPGKLGCAEGQSIYILAYQTEAEYKQAVVTSAHEMLHVAYSRLSDDEKSNIHRLLEAELRRPAADTIRSKLAGYPSEDYINEAHSFIGTELDEISAELEDHYGRYFEDRDEVLAAYRASPR